MKKVLAIAFMVLFATFQNGVAEASHSYIPSNFPHDNIIDNSIFRDTSTMSTNQIQSFLNARGGELASKTFSTNEGPASAAKVIYDASNYWGINPQVTMATLQKEQSLITSISPRPSQYDTAMGYACPTSGSCDPDKKGFVKQVWNGVFQLRYNFERASGNDSWGSGSYVCTASSSTDKAYYDKSLLPGNTVGFRTSTTASPYRTVKIANASTASLYCYTPHAFNNDPYYSGSKNFVVAFEDWFGTRYAYKNLSTPRWMQVKQDTYKKRPVSGENVGSLLETGRQIFFASSTSFDSTTFYRTQWDHDQSYDQAIMRSDLEEIPYEPLETPIYMELSKNTKKYNPRSTKQTGGTLSSGLHIKFVDQIEVDGQTFYRSEWDSDRNINNGFKLTDIRNITFQSFLEPRYMEVSSNTNQINPATSVNSEEEVSQETHLMFDSKIQIDGQWFYRTKDNTDNNEPLAISADIVNDISYRSLPELPFWIKTITNTGKVQPTTNKTGKSISADREIEVQQIIEVSGVEYYRTAWDASKGIDLAIPVADTEPAVRFVSLLRPREMIIQEYTRKYDIDSLEQIDKTLPKGMKIMFKTKIYVNGEWYLRTQYDSDRNHRKAILLSQLEG